MISKGSCDTEDWSHDVENTALPSEEYTTLKYNKIEIRFFFIVTS